MLCNLYVIQPAKIPYMFWMALSDRAYILFDAHFVINEANWPMVDILFTQMCDSSIQKEEVFDELASLSIEDFKGDDHNEKKAFAKLLNWIITLHTLALLSYRNEIMQKIFLKEAVCRTE